MSLLEDIRDGLRIVLEYFGVPPELVGARLNICCNHVTDSQCRGVIHHLRCCFHWWQENHPLLYRCVRAMKHPQSCFSCVVLLVAGSSVGQSAVRPVSQHCANDWDKSASDAFSTCALSGTGLVFVLTNWRLIISFLSVMINNFVTDNVCECKLQCHVVPVCNALVNVLTSGPSAHLSTPWIYWRYCGYTGHPVIRWCSVGVWGRRGKLCQDQARILMDVVQFCRCREQTKWNIKSKQEADSGPALNHILLDESFFRHGPSCIVFVH